MEMVMILPVLTVLFLGIVQFGMVLREHQIVQNAAREGARLSMMPTYSVSQWQGNGTSPDTLVKNYVVQYMSQEGITITTSNVTVDQDYSLSSGGVTFSASHVTISYTRSPTFGGSYFPTIAYKGEAVFRNLYP